MLLEKYIYSNSLNKTEYLRSLSMLDESSFLMRIFSFNELVEEANVKLGLVSDKPLLNTSDEEFLLLDILQAKGIHIPSFDDLKHFIDTIKDVRKTIINEDELSDFEEKLEEKYSKNQNHITLKHLYELYLEEVRDSGYIDIISLARLLFNKGKIYKSVSYIKEDNISPLEYELLYELFEDVQEISIIDLYPRREFKEVKEIRPYYGSISEVDGVLSDILEKGYNFSDVLVVLPNKTNYPALFYEKYLEHNIPFTSEIGVPITSFGSYILYKNLKDLDEKYSFNIEGFKNLFKCGYFDIKKIVVDDADIETLAEICGRLKVSYNHDENKRAFISLTELNNLHHEYLVEFLKKIDLRMDTEKMIALTFNVIDAFKKGLVYLLDNYFIDDHEYKNDAIKNYVDSLNYLARDYIKGILSQAEDIADEGVRKTYINLIENKYVYPKSFDDESIHITTIDKAISTYRKHIYFVGFSSNVFPGKVSEDYLLSDAQYEILTGIENRSINRINDKNALFRSLIDIYSNLGADISLSFSSMNIVEVGGNNPSSVLLEVDSRINKEGELNKLIAKNRYYDNKLSSLNRAVDSYLLKEEVKKPTPDLGLSIKKNYLRKYYSPSAIIDFFKCPLRFYFERILYLRPEEEQDAYDNIGYDTLGNLVHMAMEHYIHHQDMSLVEFTEYIQDVFNCYNKFDYNPKGESNKKIDYINGCINAYTFLKDFDLRDASSEYEISYQDNLSIHDVYFHGSIDLLCKDKDGNYVIIDYKTGKNVKHDDKDTISVLQGIIYALLVEMKLGITCDKAIFYYTTIDKPVVVNVKNHLDTLEELLGQFKAAVKDNAWSITEDEKENCRYCPFDGNLCKKGGE